MPGSRIDLGGLRVAAEDFLAGVLATAAQPIWVVDPRGVIRFANPAAIVALGYDSADELLGRRSHETIHYRHPDGTPYPDSEWPMLRPRATGETVSSDLDWFVRRDGSMFPVSYVSAPIEVPEGRGVVVAFTDVAERLRAEREVREGDARQALLRRVATLVAGGAPSAEVLTAIASEVALVLGLAFVGLWRYEPDGMATMVCSWSDRPHPLAPGTRWPLDGPEIATQVKHTGGPVRIEDFSEISGTIAAAVREVGTRSGTGAPIIVDGRVWGAIAAYRADPEPLPARIENRLAEFAALIAATESRDALARLADEQAALRRVATLVAQCGRSSDLFRTVAEEAGKLLGADLARLIRFEGDDSVSALATWPAEGEHSEARGLRPLEGDRLATTILRTGGPARDDRDEVSGPIATCIRNQPGLRSSVGSPIVVNGRVWGSLLVHSRQAQPLPADTESRLAGLTELVGTAMSNAEARAGMCRRAGEQAALRRVAELVARDSHPPEVFAAVAAEVGRLLSVEDTAMLRYGDDGTATVVASWGKRGRDLEVGTRMAVAGKNVTALVQRTGRPARIDDYATATGAIGGHVHDVGARSAVGYPIMVDGRLWGVMVAAQGVAEPLPAESEARIGKFTALIATAISNVQARAEAQRLTDEQAALRRVATLVATERSPAEVFAAVAKEVAQILCVDSAHLCRYETEASAIVVGAWGRIDSEVPVGTRVPLEGENVIALVHRTGRPARFDDYAKTSGRVGALGRSLGIRSAVGTPIMVEGRLWGAMVASSQAAEPLPDDAELRIAKFTELVATAISNVQARTDLATSRARIVAAADDERRRLVRDLHDGAQQRLVQTIVTLKLAHSALPPNQEPAGELVTEALEHAERATLELRELAHGILPAVLTQGGLPAAVEALASRTPVPVEVTLSVDRLPAAVEATAYFVVAEALTNVAKHARATSATVLAHVEDGTLRVQVRDDGIGGAKPDGGGLVGLADRLAVLHGQLSVESPADGGTVVAACIPLDG